jgi:dimethylhistidine N-methyltransferase
MMTEIQLTASVEEAVRNGLLAHPKSLPSWLFYDENGDRLFQRITQLQEYYLTNCEAEIIRQYGGILGASLKAMSGMWDVIELGPGDGTKTRVLLKAFLQCGLDINYYGVDISSNVLAILKKNLHAAFPRLQAQYIPTEYTKSLEAVQAEPGRKKLVLFMGANIGNFERQEARDFLLKLSEQLSTEDVVLVGFDMMKAPHIIEQAYHDQEGVTRDFNLNVLHRLNRELDAEFDVAQFQHWPIYDPVTGACRSYLVSKKEQVVPIKSLSLDIHFQAWETIDMEISQKYNEAMILQLARWANLKKMACYYDARKYYSVVLFRRL